MPDPMTIAGVIKLLKEVIELAKESNSSELREKLLELQNSIFDLTAENQELKTDCGTRAKGSKSRVSSFPIKRSIGGTGTVGKTALTVRCVGIRTKSRFS